MDENKSGNNPGNINDFDFDSFFNDNFEGFEAFESEDSKAKSAASAQPAKAEEPAAKANEAVEPESLDFLDSARADIDDILTSLSAPQQTEAPVVEAPAGTQSSANINITPRAVRRPAAKPSVTYIPDNATNINDIPGYEIETKTTKKEKKEKNVSTGEKVRKAILALSVIVIILSGGYLLKSYVIDPYMATIKNDKASGDLIDVDSMPEGTLLSEMWEKIYKQYPNVKFADDMLIKYANIYAANPDLRGWITIDSLGIDMPLAQGKDNSYYLKRDIYKKWTEYGVPFFDYRNSTYWLNRNTIIYGHNMKYSDKIFGMMEDYKTVDGFKKAPVIQCNTIYDDYTWKVYAVFLTNSEAKDDNGYIFNYTFTELNDKKFEEYIAQVDQRALYKTGVDIQISDNILTLSTCCYDFDSAKLVVLCRLVRQGESPEVDTSKATTNSNPRYPQAWYDAKNKTNPYANADRWYVD